MGKQSGMMTRMKQQHEIEMSAMRYITRQEMADMAAIALHRAFGFGEKRNMRFMNALNEVISDVADMVDEDTADKMYTIAKFEDCLKEACGSNYIPRDVRYAI